MARLTRILAICLTLAFVMMLASPPISVADGPRTYSANSGPTDGGDGHPWDDGTGTENSPGEGDDTTDPQQNILPDDDPLLQPVMTYEKGALPWIQRSISTVWLKVRQYVQSHKSATKTTMEYKTKKSRSMH